MDIPSCGPQSSPKDGFLFRITAVVIRDWFNPEDLARLGMVDFRSELPIPVTAIKFQDASFPSRAITANKRVDWQNVSGHPTATQIVPVVVLVGHSWIWYHCCGWSSLRIWILQHELQPGPRIFSSPWVCSNCSFWNTNFFHHTNASLVSFGGESFVLDVLDSGTIWLVANEENPGSMSNWTAFYQYSSGWIPRKQNGLINRGGRMKWLSTCYFSCVLYMERLMRCWICTVTPVTNVFKSSIEAYHQLELIMGRWSGEKYCRDSFKLLDRYREFEGSSAARVIVWSSCKFSYPVSDESDMSLLLHMVCILHVMGTCARRIL